MKCFNGKRHHHNEVDRVSAASRHDPLKDTCIQIFFIASKEKCWQTLVVKTIHFCSFSDACNQSSTKPNLERLPPENGISHCQVLAIWWSFSDTAYKPVGQSLSVFLLLGVVSWVGSWKAKCRRGMWEMLSREAKETRNAISVIISTAVSWGWTA